MMLSFGVALIESTITNSFNATIPGILRRLDFSFLRM